MGSLPLLSLLLAAASSGAGSVREGEAELEPHRPPAPSGTPAGTSPPFWVRLSPESVVVPPGGSAWLNCSHSCPLPDRCSLGTPLRQGGTLRGPGWVAYQLLDVRAWSSTARCSITCAGETREATARITAYKPPHSVVLEAPGSDGRKFTLRCHVTHVFPVGFLVVTLRRGGRVVYFESLERFTGLDLANVTLTYVLRAGPQNLLQPVTCHARLNLDGLVVRSSSAPMVLTVLAWSPASRALASTSIAAVLGTLLAVGVVYLRKCLAMRFQA